MAYAILSVPLPENLKEGMDKHSEIRWVEVARQGIAERLRLLEKMDELISKSDFTAEDALKHGREIKKKARAR